MLAFGIPSLLEVLLCFAVVGIPALVIWLVVRLVSRPQPPPTGVDPERMLDQREREAALREREIALAEREREFEKKERGGG